MMFTTQLIGCQNGLTSSSKPPSEQLPVGWIEMLTDSCSRSLLWIMFRHTSERNNFSNWESSSWERIQDCWGCTIKMVVLMKQKVCDIELSRAAPSGRRPLWGSLLVLRSWLMGCLLSYGPSCGGTACQRSCSERRAEEPPSVCWASH